jgi:hypothetical protein
MLREPHYLSRFDPLAGGVLGGQRSRAPAA